MSDRKSKPKKFKKRGQNSSSSSSSTSESTSSLSSDEESNARDLKPIKEYLADRRELSRQLFLAVKGDKLRMMLPQVLKKMESSELEEWCANELSGMSKTRIMCILNGQPMLQSSDSNDTDDSGPSLEIISDTEEWGDGSDLESAAGEVEPVSKKAAGSGKAKGRAKSIKDKEKGKSKGPKGRIKSEPDPKPSKSNESVKVKKETETTEQPKEKDGESLLDLLELEMRARAIRALIRKEEDIIPASISEPNANQNPGTKIRQKDRQLSLKVVQDKLLELDTSFNRNLAKASQEITEEEDVVLVLEPTTTIELLSSESEGEGAQAKRRNQKFQNERTLGHGGTETGGEETEKGTEPVADQSEKVATPELNSAPTLKPEAETRRLEVENSEQSGSKAPEEEREKVLTIESKENKGGGEPVENSVESEKSEPLEPVESKRVIGEAEEDKSTDLEIIDLDYYPDDMEGSETSERKKKGAVESPGSNPAEKRVDLVKEDGAAQTAAETWATRYYQTEDVQSVIKESKMQSEIRKRLRERQRLARLKAFRCREVVVRKRGEVNNSPGLNAAQLTEQKTLTTAEKVAREKEDSPTTGSVEEYMALKNVEAAGEKETEESAKKEKISEAVVPVSGTESDKNKFADSGGKEGGSVADEGNEDGEIIDKAE